MAKFCSYCGRPLQEGEVCNCTGAWQNAPQPPQPPQPPRPPQPPQPPMMGMQQPMMGMRQPMGYQTAGIWETMKNRMGIGDPEINKGDSFENGKRIVPDCVEAQDQETPIKQYKVATLRNRIGVIPFGKAIGRIQVTNKRVIFRAPGRTIVGRTTLQHEFAVEDLKGIEAHREYVFNFWDLIFGLIVASVGGSIMSALIMAMCTSRNGYLLYDFNQPMAIILSLIVGIAGCVPFFMLNKKWLLKLLCLGAGGYPLLTVGTTLRFSGNGFGTFMYILAIIVGLITLFCLFLNCVKPNLVLVVKAKFNNESIKIRRKRPGFMSEKDDHTGFREIFPAEDTEKCIRELNAIIADIQKTGNAAVAKWTA